MNNLLNEIGLTLISLTKANIRIIELLEKIDKDIHAIRYQKEETDPEDLELTNVRENPDHYNEIRNNNPRADI